MKLLVLQGMRAGLMKIPPQPWGGCCTGTPLSKDVFRKHSQCGMQKRVLPINNIENNHVHKMYANNTDHIHKTLLTKEKSYHSSHYITQLC